LKEAKAERFFEEKEVIPGKGISQIRITSAVLNCFNPVFITGFQKKSYQNHEGERNER
jgi:hypothetical protein